MEEVTKPEIAKALAMRRAISLAKDEGFAKINISSDCLSVVNRLNSMEDDPSLCDPVIYDRYQKADGILCFMLRQTCSS
jgi:hypothetical protein